MVESPSATAWLRGLTTISFARGNRSSSLLLLLSKRQPYHHKNRSSFDAEETPVSEQLVPRATPRLLQQLMPARETTTRASARHARHRRSRIHVIEVERLDPKPLNVRATNP